MWNVQCQMQLHRRLYHDSLSTVTVVLYQSPMPVVPVDLQPQIPKDHPGPGISNNCGDDKKNVRALKETEPGARGSG